METKQSPLKISLKAVVLDCRDVGALSAFYCSLLGWEKTYDEGDEWVDVSPPSGGVRIALQRNEDYVPPVWPEEPDRQQQMVHLDFTVADFEQMALAVEHAIRCGAKKAAAQFSDEWTVMIDPVGHPFCFVIG